MLSFLASSASRTERVKIPFVMHQSKHLTDHKMYSRNICFGAGLLPVNLRSVEDRNSGGITLSALDDLNLEK